MLEQSLNNQEWVGFQQLPYPGHLAKEARLKDGKIVTIRPIRPDDEPLLVRLHQTLSDQSVYFRYFHMIGLRQRIDHERLSHICQIDYDKEIVLVAEYTTPAGQPEVIGVARLNKIPGTKEAEFAILVSDAYQGRGLGSEMLRRLVQIGHDTEITAIFGDIHAENKVMQMVCRKMGFQLVYSQADHFFTAKLDV